MYPDLTEFSVDSDLDKDRSISHAGGRKFLMVGRRTLPPPHDIQGPAAGIKRPHLPKRSTLSFEHASLQSNDNASLGLVVDTPAW